MKKILFFAVAACCLFVSCSSHRGAEKVVEAFNAALAAGDYTTAATMVYLKNDAQRETLPQTLESMVETGKRFNSNLSFAEIANVEAMESENPDAVSVAFDRVNVDGTLNPFEMKCRRVDGVWLVEIY